MESKNKTRDAYVLDIGSASVRLLAGRYTSPTEVSILYSKGYVTRLREDLTDGGGLDGPRSKETLNKLRQLITEAKPVLSRVGSCICTQAVRQAGKKDEFLDEVRRITGLEPEIVTGEREGELAWMGSREFLDKGSMIVDLGGGSTEFITEKQGGGVNVISRSVASATGKIKSMDEARDCWREYLQNLPVKDPVKIVLIGGTATTYAAVAISMKQYRDAMVHGMNLQVGFFRRQAEFMTDMSEEDILKIPGIEPGRESIISTGGFHLAAICELSGVDSAVISSRGIRYGRLRELSSGVGY